MDDLISRRLAIDMCRKPCMRNADCSDFEMEIMMLPSAQPEINCSEFPNNSDTISRQDAVSRQRLLSDLKELITAWEKYPVMAEQIKGVEVAIGYVELIPSAQPETHEERTETHACDCISRQMLLEYIHGEPVGRLLCDKYNLDGLIEQLPSAQSEIVRCKDCDWWTKQEDSLQGRCALLQMYPTGGWFCGNARRREVTT